MVAGNFDIQGKALVIFITRLVEYRYIGSLHHELNLCLDGLEGVLQDFHLLQPAAEPQSLHSSLLFCLCTAPNAAAENICPAIHVVGPAPPPHYAKPLKYLDWYKAVITRTRFRMG